MRPRLVASGVREEGCVSSYGTFGVQGSPQHSLADFAAAPLKTKIPIFTGGVKCVFSIAAERKEFLKKL